MPISWDFPLTFLLLAYATTACGLLDGKSRKGNDEGGVPVPVTSGGLLPAPLAKLAALEQGYTWYLEPFAAPSVEANVHVLASGTGESQVGAPLTIPGYHWPWELPRVNVVSKPTSQTLRKGEKAVYTFLVPFSDSWRTRWPAVTGMQGTVAGHLSAAGFVSLRPSNLALAHRVYFVDARGAPLTVLRHTAKDCGRGCVEFLSFAELLDTPVSYGSSAPLEKKDGAVTLVTAVTTAEGKAKAENLFARAGQPLAAGALFADLTSRWGKISSSYTLHLGLQKGCGYQGLEHAMAAALALGVDCDESVVRRFLLLTTHEMIHAWNVKAIFPREHARLSLTRFPIERTRQLYFYEGFTEGLARLVISRTQAQRVPLADRLTVWNETINSLSLLASHTGTPEALSLESPSQGYALGAWLALRAAVEARKTSSAIEAYDAVFSVMKELGKGNAEATAGGTPFDLATPAFRRFTFSAYEGLVSDARHSVGYDRTSLALAFASALGFPADHPFLAEFFSDAAHAPTLAELRRKISDAAAATGLTTVEDTGTKALHFAVSPSGETIDPDAPDRSPFFPL